MNEQRTSQLHPRSSSVAHRRRQRYSGKYPRRYEEKYKEHNPERYAETIAKVLASGKTPAGAHRPIMVQEVLAALQPRPGEFAVDCTLGHGGHARELLSRLQPGGRLLGLDIDPLEMPRTEARLRALGFGADSFAAYRTNFAGLSKVLVAAGLSGADLILADLGVSSMQIDDPTRGFSVKFEGPLDMRMNPQRGQSASALIQKATAEELAFLLVENADETHAHTLGKTLAGQRFTTTMALARAVRESLRRLSHDEQERSLRRVFQAVRIAVNDELSALDALLRQLAGCLNSGGRIAILTFHSGEDRRVKKAFAAGLHKGCYAEISRGVIRPSVAERHSNPRSTPAKLRWARKA